MQSAAKTLMPEISDDERRRLINRLDRRADKMLIDELKTLDAWQGIVIEVPDAATAEKLRVFSSHAQVVFPVFCTFGDGASKRIELGVQQAPDRVRETAISIARDRNVRATGKALADLTGRFEASIDDVEGLLRLADDIAFLVEGFREDLTAEIAAYCAKANGSEKRQPCRAS